MLRGGSGDEEGGASRRSSEGIGARVCLRLIDERLLCQHSDVC